MPTATIRFFTDTATLAVFDPAVLAHRVADDAGWWCGDFALLDEFRTGLATLLSLGGDGVYQVRITDGDLAPHERDYAVEVIRGMGLLVESGSIFVGPGECIPSGGHALDENDLQRGGLLQLTKGKYVVDVFGISWFESPIWWREDGRVPEDAPPDFVVLVRERDGPYSGLQSEPRFTDSSAVYLFPSESRRLGPEPGMVLKSKVRKHPDGKLSVADCGPGSYRVLLNDYSALEWRRGIRIRVLTVDHDARSMCGEFIEFAD